VYTTWVSQFCLGFFLYLFWEGTFGDKWHRFFTEWISHSPICHATSCTEGNSKHWPIISGLASSFLHPPPDSWRKGHCCLCAVFLMQIPYYSTSTVHCKTTTLCVYNVTECWHCSFKVSSCVILYPQHHPKMTLQKYWCSSCCNCGSCFRWRHCGQVCTDAL